MKRRTLIVGTAGREFHVFNTVYRHDPHHRVLGFTAAEYASGEQGRYPGCLAGPQYPDGIPILAEAQLEEVIAEFGIADVVFAYSELGCREVSTLAARVLSTGADFQLIGPARTMLAATKPVIAVTAARAGAGKSPTVRYLAELLGSWGLRVAVLHHPVGRPRFGMAWVHQPSPDGTGVDGCATPVTEPFEGQPTARSYSGPDFATVVRAAQAEADVIIWDGASNDLPFLQPDLHIVLADPLRVGEEREYFPGEVCLRLADLVLISKCNAASEEQVDLLEKNIDEVNPAATVLRADSPVVIEHGELVTGRTVVVVEDSLTLSMGSLLPAAGLAAAHQAGVSAVISPMPQAVGSLALAYRSHPEAQAILPAVGYGPDQLADLKATLDATGAEAVIDATRVDLASLLAVQRPVAKAYYGFRPHQPDVLADLVRAAVSARG